MISYKSALAAIDTDDTDGAIRVLNASHSLLPESAVLHVISIVPDYSGGMVGPFFPENHEEQAMATAKAFLMTLVDEHIPSTRELKFHIAHGGIYEEVLSSADDLEVDVIVIGARRPKLKNFFLGANAAKIVRHAPQSVFVVRSKD